MNLKSGHHMSKETCLLLKLDSPRLSQSFKNISGLFYTKKCVNHVKTCKTFNSESDLI